MQICSHPALQKYHRPFNIGCDDRGHYWKLKVFYFPLNVCTLQAEILKYEDVASWIFVYICSEAPSLTPAASCFSYPHVSFFQNRRQNSLSGKNTHLFSKSEKIETTLTHRLSERPCIWFLGRILSSLMTFRLHFYVSGQNMGRNSARFTTYRFKICQRRDKLIFVMIFV